MMVLVSTLTPSIREALKSVQYGARDVSVEPAETVCPAGSAGQGQRSFLILVDPNTGRAETKLGSWGGANMFNPRNQVDLDTASYPMPPNGIVIQGNMGHPRTFARVYVHPSTLAQYLPAETGPELSPAEKKTLNAYCSLTSAGRKDEFAEWNYAAERKAEGRYVSEYQHCQTAKVTQELTEALIGKGLLARNKASAVSVTLAGKNARTR